MPVSISAFLVGVWLAGIKGVALAVALVMGIFASIWFWIAICRATGWSIRVMLAPVLLPTVTMILTLAVVLAAPLPVPLTFYLQPPLIILIYGIVISFISAGKVPRMLIDVVSRSLNKNVRHSSNK